MSVAVTMDELPSAITKQIGWCYLLTTNDAGLPRILAIVPAWMADGESLCAEISPRTAANVTARPDVTLLYPPAGADGLSLIVDGSAAMDGAVMRFIPARAVMHRPAAGACGEGSA